MSLRSSREGSGTGSSMGEREQMQVQAPVEFQGIRRGKIENDRTLMESEMLDRTFCGKDG